MHVIGQSVTHCRHIQEDAAMHRFCKEAEVLFTLSHPNVVRVFGATTDLDPPAGVTPCLVLELLPHTLTRGMARLTPDQKHSVALGIATGLSYLRTRTPVLLHCDIKPDNILLTVDLVPKLADFGLHKEREAEFLSKKGTSVQGGHGTVGYIVCCIASMGGVSNAQAPEAYDGNYGYTDVFAFGMIVYEMFVGARPFAGKHAVEVQSLIVKGERPIIPATVHFTIAAIINGCWRHGAMHV